MEREMNQAQRILKNNLSEDDARSLRGHYSWHLILRKSEAILAAAEAALAADIKAGRTRDLIQADERAIARAREDVRKNKLVLRDAKPLSPVAQAALHAILERRRGGF